MTPIKSEFSILFATLFSAQLIRFIRSFAELSPHCHNYNRMSNLYIGVNEHHTTNAAKQDIQVVNFLVIDLDSVRFDINLSANQTKIDFIIQVSELIKDQLADNGFCFYAFGLSVFLATRLVVAITITRNITQLEIRQSCAREEPTDADPTSATVILIPASAATRSLDCCISTLTSWAIKKLELIDEDEWQTCVIIRAAKSAQKQHHFWSGCWYLLSVRGH